MRSGEIKIAVDITPLLEDHWTGIPIFTRRLIQALRKQTGIALEFIFQLTRIPETEVLAAIQAGSGTALRADFERNAGERYSLVDSKAHILYPSVKETCGVSKHEASTVHDISTLLMPEFHEPANVDYHMRRLKNQLRSDEIIFCASEATRTALERAYPSVVGRTRLLLQYVDWPDEFSAIERNLPVPILGRYALVIGTVEPRKNLELLIRALNEPSIRHSELRFVILGKQGWKVDEFMAKMTSAERERLVFLGYVTEFQKYRLLRHSEFLVYPSIYEGFGIPALEAMSLGKPVMASMTSSFPDLIGEAGMYFDPLSPQQFAVAFDQITDPDTRNSLAENALEIAAAYTPERFALPVIEWAKAG